MEQERNIVIIGCGAGGGTAAQLARKTDRKASIIVFEKGKYSQYSKCGLPYAISGDIPNLKNLIEFNQEWFKKANIDLYLETTVEKIDIKNRIFYAKKGKETIEKPYTSLIISTGADPSTPPINNIKTDGVFFVRSINDAEKIQKNIIKGKKAIIIGAGLIGMEMADALFNKGLKISIVEALPNILSNNLDTDMSKLVLDHIPKDIEIFTDHIATEVISNNQKISGIIIKNNKSGMEKTLDADIVIIAAGNKPNIDLAKNIGCEIGVTGGVVVNRKSETSIKDIYSVGDCTQYVDFITAKPCLVGLGSVAVRQGFAAGINAAGGNYELLKGFLNTSTSKVFGLEIASVGPITNNLSEFTVLSGRFNGSSLPDYFPGGKPVSIKVSVDKYTNIIMNAQCVGDKAAQRINTFASAILGELDIETFRKLETAYAPPIAPTLDSITIVCDIISKKQKQK